MPVNPIVGTFRTADGRFVNLTMLQAGRYWADVCRHIGLDELIDDERFDTAEKLMANAGAAGALVAAAILAKPLAHWLGDVQDARGSVGDGAEPAGGGRRPAGRANGYILAVTDSEGHERELVSSPVQFDETPFEIARGPQFAEHTDEIVSALGHTDDELIQLKIDGAIT